MNQIPKQKVVLITGSSSGIGYELVKALLQSNYFVIAAVHTAKGLEALASLNEPRILPLVLDVTKIQNIDESIKPAISILEKNGLYALINNAGIAIPGPLELMSPAIFQEHFQVNVVGILAITQALLKYLYMTPSRVINIGSISGRFTSPFLGAYSASKFALRALTQTMRMELKSGRISFSLIEAGNIKTPIWEKGIEYLKNNFGDKTTTNLFYNEQLTALALHAKNKYNKAKQPIVVVETIKKALNASKPKDVYRVGSDAWILYLLSKLFTSEQIHRFYLFYNKKIKRCFVQCKMSLK